MAKTIAELHIEGVIEKENATYNHKWLLETIEKLEEDKRTVALLLYIDSPGGGVYQSDEVYLRLMQYREKTKKPVYAYFASLAASGGYYIGCAADKIYANRNTLTGSIGVIAGNFTDVTGLMGKIGVKSETIHAGRNKIMGHPTVPVTDEQRAIMQSVADECYGQFTAIVSERRGLDAETVRGLADGRIYTARQALEAGLVDGIATHDEAVSLLKEAEFHDKDYKAEVKKYAVKQKKGIKKLLEGTSGLTPLGELLSLGQHPLPFPAWYWKPPVTT